MVIGAEKRIVLDNVRVAAHNAGLAATGYVTNVLIMKNQ